MFEDFLNTPFLFRRRGGSFNPASLFKSGEVGWFEPMIPGVTLFQNATGTTPVTAPGQPVGLSLDASKGLVQGGELFSNQPSVLDNSGGAATVTHTAATRTVQVTVAGSNTSYPRLQVSVGAVSGRRYVVSGRIDGDRSLVSGVRFAITGSVNSLSYNASTGVFSGIQEAGATPAVEIQVNGTLLGTVTIATLSVKELPGNHFVQSTALNRPIYQVDAQGRGYLSHNGSNQWMATAAFAWGSDKATIVAGVRKLSDAAQAIVFETSAAFASNNGAMTLQAPVGASASFGFGSKGTAASNANVTTGYASPATAVMVGIGDIANDVARLRINSVQVASPSADQGTGNYGTYALYAGARGGTSLFFNGNRYPNMGINRLLTAGELAQVEAWVNSKTGAY